MAVKTEAVVRQYVAARENGDSQVARVLRNLIVGGLSPRERQAFNALEVVGKGTSTTDVAAAMDTSSANAINVLNRLEDLAIVYKVDATDGRWHHYLWYQEAR